MQKLFISLLLLLPLTASSQQLDGEWTGTQETESIGTAPNNIVGGQEGFPIRMKLVFTWNKDSTYTVYTYTKLKSVSDSMIVCRTVCRVTGDSVFIEEVEKLQPRKTIAACFQKMKMALWMVNGKLQLNGIWKSEGNNCDARGFVWFRKKKHKAIPAK